MRDDADDADEAAPSSSSSSSSSSDDGPRANPLRRPRLLDCQLTTRSPRPLRPPPRTFLYRGEGRRPSLSSSSSSASSYSTTMPAPTPHPTSSPARAASAARSARPDAELPVPNRATHAVVCPGAPDLHPPPANPYAPGAEIAGSQVPPEWPAALVAPTVGGAGARRSTKILRRIRNDFGRDYWILATVLDEEARKAVSVAGKGMWIRFEGLTNGKAGAGGGGDTNGGHGGDGARENGHGNGNGNGNGEEDEVDRRTCTLIHGVRDSNLTAWVELRRKWAWEEVNEELEKEGEKQGFWGCSNWALANTDQLH